MLWCNNILHRLDIGEQLDKGVCVLNSKVSKITRCLIIDGLLYNHHSGYMYVSVIEGLRARVG